MDLFQGFVMSVTELFLVKETLDARRRMTVCNIYYTREERWNIEFQKPRLIVEIRIKELTIDIYTCEKSSDKISDHETSSSLFRYWKHEHRRNLQAIFPDRPGAEAFDFGGRRWIPVRGLL